jgi:ubiquitin C-terminal hydrolase
VFADLEINECLTDDFQLFKQIGDLLEFPLELDMKRFLSKQKSAPVPSAENAEPAVKVVDDVKKSSSSYLLSSVVVHEGSAGYGHYICYARPDPKKYPNGWLKLNDNAVSDISAKDVFETSFGTKNPDKYSKNAYMLFYTRK